MLLPVDGNDNINDQKYIVARDKKMSHRYLSACFLAVKFGLSEKHKKFEKNLPHGLDVYYVSKCTKHKKDCANFCALLRKSEL